MKRSNKIIINLRRWASAFSLLLFLLLSCRLPKTLVLPDNKPMPDTFAVNSTDTAGIGQLPWQQFFEDEHLRA
jgi:multidrug efflux system outer membrane protein